MNTQRDVDFKAIVDVIDEAFDELRHPQGHDAHAQRALINEMLLMAPSGLSRQQLAHVEARRKRFEQLG
jgi:hypothetical protein